MPAKPTPIPIDILARLKADLARLPAKPKTHVTRQEAVRQLEVEIRHAIEHLGYSLADIAALFIAAGVNVRPDTIGNALRSLRPKAHAKKAAPKSTSAPMPKSGLPFGTQQTGSDVMVPPASHPPLMTKAGQPVRVQPQADGGTDGARG